MTEMEKSLNELAEEINQEHHAFRRAFKATYRSALRVGDLLDEAKARAGHGNWGTWVEENCDFSMRTAQVYMRIASNRTQVEGMLKSAEPAHLSIEGVLKELSSPREIVARAPLGTELNPLSVEIVREPAPPVAIEDAPFEDERDRQIYERDYRRLESERGQEDAQQWLGERMRSHSEARKTYADRLYAEFEDKVQFIAFELYKVVFATTARFEDIPKENPLPDFLDAFEWRQVLAQIERWRDGNAATWIDRYAESGKGRSIYDMRQELAYVLRHNDYADIRRLEEDAKILREAGQNFAALAQALEDGMKERDSE
jgi:hypothetical protein